MFRQHNSNLILDYDLGARAQSMLSATVKNISTRVQSQETADRICFKFERYFKVRVFYSAYALQLYLPGCHA